MCRKQLGKEEIYYYYQETFGIFFLIPMELLHTYSN